MATTVPAGFDELLRRLALTENQKTTAAGHIASVKSFLENYFEMTTDGAFSTGSLRRQTMVRWTRDVDIMAVLSVPRYYSVHQDDSSRFLYMVRDALNERFDSTTVSSKRLAVRLDFADIVVDVVPCFRREGGGYLMPNGAGGWRATNAPFHSTLMKNANIASGQRLKPVVKLMKAWDIRNGHHLLSIHVELMVERMWRSAKVLTAPYSSLVAEPHHVHIAEVRSR